jgi:hypothetical protein
MALTGQLSDMSLAELIEFFCNQRKTGRLKVDYHRGHGVFFIKEGELVDAKVGALSGAEAVYFALTLPNAAFDFSSDIEPPRRTISDAWTRVVLEGLRRLDEGISPSEADAFGGWSPNEADMAMFMNHVERLGGNNSSNNSASKGEAHSSAAPFSMMVESASGNDGSSKKKFMIAGIAACFVLVCLVVAVPLLRSGSKAASASAPVTASQPAAAPSDATTAADASASSQVEPTMEQAAPPAVDANADAAFAARREREAKDRERREREERMRRSEDARLASNEKSIDAAKLAASAVSGPKTVRVTVTYDEAGRVTQASVAGASPGAETFGGTAVRIARGKRFPAGKAGSTVVTIPAN